MTVAGAAREDNWADRYAAAMHQGYLEYMDAIDAIDKRFGTKAYFTQTGGMCAAIAVPLEAGYELLVTDANDSLSWDRSQKEGWGVGMYAPDNDGTHMFDLTTDDDSVEALLVVIDRVLRGEGRVAPS